MKATGIVRRIDDLGRIVVPKEIRKTMRIRQGDPMEIFINREGEILLKKYSPIGELSEFASSYAESLAQTTGYLVCITDLEAVIAAAGPRRKEFQGKPLDMMLTQLMEKRKTQMTSQKEDNLIRITPDDDREYQAEAISTIICSGDVIGSVVICGREEDSWQPEAMRQLIVTAAGFLGRQME